MADRWVVRGKNDRGEDVCAVLDRFGVAEAKLAIDGGEPHSYRSVEDAEMARWSMVNIALCAESARIFEVDESGKETAIPSFEELLSTAQAHRAKCMDACGCSVCGLLRKTAGTPKRGDWK